MKILLYSFLCASVSIAAPESARHWALLASRDTLDLFFGDRPVGSFTQVVSVSETAVTIERRCNAGGGGGGRSASVPSIQLSERRVYGLDGTLTAAFQELAGASGSTSWTLEKKPKGGWRYAVTTGAATRELAAGRVRENLAVTRELYRGIKERTLRPGDSLRDSLFELTTGQTVVANVRCIAVPSAGNNFTWTMETFESLLGRTQKWVLDTNGATLFQEIFPFVGKRAGLSRPAGPPVPLFSLVESLAVAAPRPAGSDERVCLKLGPAAAPDSSVFSFYERSGACWILRRQPERCGDGRAAPLPDDTVRLYTAPTATMQSDAAAIKRLADSLVKGRRDRCDSIIACWRSVFASIEKRYTPVFSNALQTLEAGYGDCGEHAVLLAALLRSVHIPARVALGLVYVQEKRGYFYHAWVMAYAGSWLFADAALGAFPANRDRVPLVIDDTGERVLNIAKLFGTIKIDYVKGK